MGDAFHHAAIAEEGVGVVVDDLVAIAVELGGHDLFRQGEAHGVGDALAQGTGGGLDARGVAVFGVARGLAVQLTEILQVVDGQVVAGQVQQRIDEHGAVAVGQHEAVTVGPLGVARVVLELIVPEHLGDVGHAHGGAGVAAVGFLHGIHAEGTDGVGSITTAGHCGVSWQRQSERAIILAQPGHFQQSARSPQPAGQTVAPSATKARATGSMRRARVARAWRCAATTSA